MSTTDLGKVEMYEFLFYGKNAGQIFETFIWHQEIKEEASQSQTLRLCASPLFDFSWAQTIMG